MSERVPEGWKLESLGKYVNEKSLKFDGKSTIPVLSVTKYDGFVNSLSYFNKQVFSRDLTSYKVVKRGQFAYATIHLDEGSLGLLIDYDEGLISPMYTVFETKNGLDSRFLFYLMKSDLYMTKYPSLGQGSINRRMSISFKVLSDLEILYPPLPEQQKIASILTSVDEVIEKTQSQINKLQDMKKGTMNELLTKGIGHTKFKDSPVGKIPKGWEVKEFGEVTLLVKSGLSRRISLQDIGLPVINSGNIQNNILDVNELKYWYLDDPQGANTEDYILDDGDILLNFINSMSQIGKTCIFKNIGRPSIYTTNAFRIKVALNYDSVFIHQVMVSDKFQTEIQLISKPAVNQASFTKQDLIKVQIPLPPLPEQQKIASILSSIDSHIEEKQRKLEQTRSLKKSLTQDLLTGKVRVAIN